jgi:Methyltransferase domain
MGAGSGSGSHWVQWHAMYEDPESNLSVRLRAVQSALRCALDEVAGPAAHPGRIRVVSVCAGQGRDVIDVVATHPRGSEVSAVLIELDPDLVAFARERAAAAGVADRVRVIEGDASQCRSYVVAESSGDAAIPADIVLICGVFGNISPEDITGTIQAMRGFCVPGGQVVWTRHRRQPDRTPAVRADFAAAGFTELGYEAPDGTVLAVGRHRLDGAPTPFDSDHQLFDFVGDGSRPA